jgi:hypothetical protein
LGDDLKDVNVFHPESAMWHLKTYEKQWKLILVKSLPTVCF